MNKNHNKFKKGSGCFTCQACGKRTRSTNLDHADYEMCEFCFEEALLENSLSDGSITEQDFNIRLKELKQQFKIK